jgi:hypothetical protein
MSATEAPPRPRTDAERRLVLSLALLAAAGPSMPITRISRGGTTPGARTVSRSSRTCTSRSSSSAVPCGGRAGKKHRGAPGVREHRPGGQKACARPAAAAASGFPRRHPTVRDAADPGCPLAAAGGHRSEGGGRRHVHAAVGELGRAGAPADGRPLPGPPGDGQPLGGVGARDRHRVRGQIAVTPGAGSDGCLQLPHHARSMRGSAAGS